METTMESSASRVSNPLVSVIVPAYNNAAIIVETIDSIINQTYQNWELVIIDDASPDNTFEVLQQYAAKDSRIKTERITRDKSVKTHCAVRIEALARAKGDFIAFMDGDDLYEPDAFETMVRYLQNNEDCQCVYGLFREIDMDGKLIANADERHWNDLDESHNAIPSKELHSWDNIIFQRIPMMLQLMMVRRPFIDAAGGLNPYIIWDDYYFFVRMCVLNRDAVHRIPHYVFRYRYNHGGLSKSTQMFKKLLKNVRVAVDGLMDELHVDQIDPKYTASFLSAKMYADIAWLRLRSNLRGQTIQACWYGFLDTRVTFGDWCSFCGGMFVKAMLPDGLWQSIKSIKQALCPSKKAMVAG